MIDGRIGAFHKFRSILSIAATLVSLAFARAATTEPQPREIPKPCAVSRESSPIELANGISDEYKKRMSDLEGLDRYRDANAHLKYPSESESRVVFLGDSITDVWRLDEFFPGKPYLNRGISGQATPQMLVRFRQDVIDLKPKVVVILAGINDIAVSRGPMRLEDIEGYYSSMAELASLHNIRVVFSSVMPINNYTAIAEPSFSQRSPSKILELNRWLKKYCSKSGYVYLDYFSAMVDGNGLLKRDLSEDRMHPNRDGYKIMAPLAEDAIRKAEEN